MKDKIVIIGANDFQNRLILKAKGMGLETHVFAWKCGDIGEETADYFYPISITEKEEILKECKRINPLAILSIASDLAVGTVNYVARELGLISNSERCDRLATNKYYMRQALEEAGLVVPRYTIAKESFNNNDIKGMSYPLIVKPTDRSGSRGINRIENENELARAIDIAQNVSFQCCAVVEEYIEGDEYSCESISIDGYHQVLAYTKKFTTGDPNYIEIGHMQPAQFDDCMEIKIERTIKKALDALEIKNGASHTEFKIDSKGEVYIIEIGARMAGDCIGSDLVELSTGIDYVKLVIEVACGKKPQINGLSKTSNAVVRFVLSPKDLEVIEKLEEKYEVVRKSVFNVDFASDVTDSSTRHGYIIITSDNAASLLSTENW